MLTATEVPGATMAEKNAVMSNRTATESTDELTSFDGLNRELSSSLRSPRLLAYNCAFCTSAGLHLQSSFRSNERKTEKSEAIKNRQKLMSDQNAFKNKSNCTKVCFASFRSHLLEMLPIIS
jgi:hypothetical protein